jgi:hypothetical protein
VVRSYRGRPVADGIEEQGLEAWLAGLRAELVSKTYRPDPVRRVMISYADDFVILSRGRAAEALAWTKAVMTKLGLTINEAKTSLRNARQERLSLTTPDKIRSLQRKLYCKAKAEPTFREGSGLSIASGGGHGGGRTGQ